MREERAAIAHRMRACAENIGRVLGPWKPLNLLQVLHMGKIQNVNADCLVWKMYTVAIGRSTATWLYSALALKQLPPSFRILGHDDHDSGNPEPIFSSSQSKHRRHYLTGCCWRATQAALSSGVGSLLQRVASSRVFCMRMDVC